MKRIVYSILCTAVLFSVGACYDDSALRKDIDDLQKKVEELQSDVKKNVSAIEALAAASEGAVTITSVNQIENGYRISFSDGTTAELTNGADGQNGQPGQNAPVLGLLKDGDVLYWTLGGEPLLYEDARIPVSGADGKTPQFKIENDVWKVSFDGSVWTDVPVTGSQEDFDMSETETEYIFTLGATELRIPKIDAFSIKVSCDELELEPAMTLTFTYEITGADETTHVLIEAKNIDAVLDEVEKTINVTAPDVIQNAYVLVKAVRNSDSKYAAQYISIKKMAYGTFGNYIVSHENEYLNW